MLLRNKILVVEDEDHNREVLQLHLACTGFTLLEAECGERAVDLLLTGKNRFEIGLIFCDIRMPRLNGIETIEIFMQQAGEIPVIALTGYPDLELVSLLRGKGVKDFLIKPVSKQKLLETVQRHFGALPVV